MNKDPITTSEAAALGREAEKRLRAETADIDNFRIEVETQRLLRELQVHQVELEMQNEELLKANCDMENLLASSGVASIFLDQQLIIRGFTPALRNRINKFLKGNSCLKSYLIQQHIWR